MLKSAAALFRVLHKSRAAPLSAGGLLAAGSCAAIKKQIRPRPPFVTRILEKVGKGRIPVIECNRARHAGSYLPALLRVFDWVLICQGSLARWRFLETNPAP